MPSQAPTPPKPAAKTGTAKPAKAVNTKHPAPAKAAGKPVKKTAAPAKPAKASPAKSVVAPSAEEKTKKIKLVRDSFTMPKGEYLQIDALKQTLAKQGRPAKKSELLRAGLMLLVKQSPGALLACVDALTPIKTGRPRKA